MNISNKKNIQPETPVVAKTNTNSPHGSRRGAGSLIGAALGWFLGSMITLFTKQIAWMIVLPLAGIILGAVIGRFVLPKEAPSN